MMSSLIRNVIARKAALVFEIQQELKANDPDRLAVRDMAIEAARLELDIIDHFITFNNRESIVTNAVSLCSLMQEVLAPDHDLFEIISDMQSSKQKWPKYGRQAECRPPRTPRRKSK